MQHIISLEGRSLIRTFLAGATKDAAISSRATSILTKLRKKLVKNNGFWKINAIRPKIKAKRGRMRKCKKEGNAKYGGLVKELGF